MGWLTVLKRVFGIGLPVALFGVWMGGELVLNAIRAKECLEATKEWLEARGWLVWRLRE